MIYVLECVKFKSSKEGQYNASIKPRTDTIRTVLHHYKNSKFIQIVDYSASGNGRIARLIRLFCIVLQFLFKCSRIRSSIIFLQYPYITHLMTSVVKRLKPNNKIVVLVHDLSSARFNKEVESERNFFSNVDVAVVHTDAMAKCLRDLDFKGEIRILEFFDYLIKDNYIERTILDKEIVFAGNLSKSTFIKELTSLPVVKGVRYYLYGIKSDDILTNEAVLYKGYFKAEEINNIEGNWGLVWDGDSLDSCSGCYGEYLKINAPFKFSMYLAVGMPVIVWSESAMASYVKKYNLGICVDSLRDINSEIENLNSEAISSIIDSVRKVSVDVRKGHKLVGTLNSIDGFLSEN